MAVIDDLINSADGISKETAKGANTAKRVGETIKGIAQQHKALDSKVDTIIEAGGQVQAASQVLLSEIPGLEAANVQEGMEEVSNAINYIPIGKSLVSRKSLESPSKWKEVASGAFFINHYADYSHIYTNSNITQMRVGWYLGNLVNGKKYLIRFKGYSRNAYKSIALKPFTQLDKNGVAGTNTSIVVPISGDMYEKEIIYTYYNKYPYLAFTIGDLWDTTNKIGTNFYIYDFSVYEIGNVEDLAKNNLEINVDYSENEVSSYTGEKLDFTQRQFFLENTGVATFTQGVSNFGKYVLLLTGNSTSLVIKAIDKTGSVPGVPGTLTLPDFCATNHNNTLSISDTYYSEEDAIPLIYISVSNPSDTIIRGMYCMRIHKNEEGTAIVECIQKIGIPTDAPYNSSCVLGEKGQFIAYGYAAPSSGNLVIKRYKLPSYTIGDTMLDSSSEIDSFELRNVGTTQGACYVNGKLYMPFGTSYCTLYVVDIARRIISSILPISNIIKGEFEDIFFYDKELYLSLRSKYIYRLHI